MINFIDKIDNIIKHKKSVELRFLTLQEQSQLKNKIKDSSLYILDGGYKDAELKRASFYSKHCSIVCFKIIPKNKHMELTHQNILGSLLSLQIEKDSIGDILPKQGIFFTTSEISTEIKYSFSSIGNSPITIQEITSTDIQKEQEFLDFRTTVDSLRLDLIVSKITKMSRNDAKELITKEFVKKNHNIATKHTTIIQDGDIISIRKYGRFVIRDTKNTSKKGKIVLNYSKYQ